MVLGGTVTGCTAVHSVTVRVVVGAVEFIVVQIRRFVLSSVDSNHLSIFGVHRVEQFRVLCWSGSNRVSICQLHVLGQSL